jgi:UDP-N-acetylmuramyl tripeptide synthase
LAIVRLRKRKVFVGFAHTPTTFEKVDQTFIIAL